MIRFRLGQRWKAEPSLTPTDSFGLELDGVELLAEAHDESLGAAVLGLTQAMSRLCGGERFAQLSLPEAHLEVVFARRGDLVDLKVVSLGHPAKLAKPVVQVGLSELRHAVLRCAEGWVEELSGLHSSRFPAPAEVAQAMKALAETELVEAKRPPFQGAFAYERFAPERGFGFRIQDFEDALLSYRKPLGASLGHLLVPGELVLRQGKSTTRAATPALFLAVFELARQGTALLRAREFDEPTGRLQPGGILQPITLKLRESAGLLTTIFETGLDLIFALLHRNPSLAHNPYVSDLSAVCRQGLTQLKQPLPPQAGPEKPTSPRTRATASPLKTKGRLKRLSFSPLWSQTLEASPGAGTVLPLKVRGMRGVVALTPAGASIFSAEGALLAQRPAPLGAAGLPDGSTLCAFPDRLVAYRGLEKSARWLRSHEGEPLNPEPLITAQGIWLLRSQGRTILAIQEVAGRELWRLTPAGSQRAHASLQGQRGIVTTDSGYLFGVDLSTGLIRYRARFAHPFHAPTHPWGKRLLALAQDRNAVALTAMGAHTGEVEFSEELPLRKATPPIAQGNSLYLAGEHGDGSLLLSLTREGRRRWHRALPQVREPVAVLPTPKGVYVTCRSGACVKVSVTGEVRWTNGTRTDCGALPGPPILRRDVLLIPGETVRALDPKNGATLAEVRVGQGVASLVVDAQLTIYTLTEGKVLSAHRLATSLAII
jgi:hypothetical protein